MEKKPRDILSNNNISITNPRLLVIEELLSIKKPIAIEDLQIKLKDKVAVSTLYRVCLLYTSPSPRDVEESRMPSSA